MSIITRRIVDNDYSFGQGRRNLAANVEAVLQRCKSKLLQYQGEWFLNQNDGTAWQTILGQSRDDSQLKRMIRSKIRSIEDVIDIQNLQVYFDSMTRQASIYSELNTRFGLVAFDQNIDLAPTEPPPVSDINRIHAEDGQPIMTEEFNFLLLD